MAHGLCFVIAMATSTCKCLHHHQHNKRRRGQPAADKAPPTEAGTHHTVLQSGLPLPEQRCMQEMAPCNSDPPPPSGTALWRPQHYRRPARHWLGRWHPGCLLGARHCKRALLHRPPSVDQTCCMQPPSQPPSQLRSHCCWPPGGGLCPPSLQLLWRHRTRHPPPTCCPPSSRQQPAPTACDKLGSGVHRRVHVLCVCRIRVYTIQGCSCPQCCSLQELAAVRPLHVA